MRFPDTHRSRGTARSHLTERSTRAGVRRLRRLAPAALGAVIAIARPAIADVAGVWVGDSTGSAIPPPTVKYNRDHTIDLTATCSLTGVDFTTDVGHLVFDATPPAAMLR